MKKASKYILIFIILLISFHFIRERVNYAGIPSGDEGSWMAVAAELSRGNGFTTRWLEWHFQKPYILPRPDDYRYPALVSILAVNFRLFGISYTTAL